MTMDRCTVGVALLLVGCQPRAQGDVAIDTTTRGEAVAVTHDSVQPAPAADTNRPAAAVEPARPVSTPPTDTTPITAPRREETPLVTVRDLLDSDAYVGKRVQVTGRCHGYAADIAVGPPPVSRSDWKLVDGGAAIFVSGRLPPGCSPTEGSAEHTTILALVAQDTLPAFGDRAATARRYLVRIVR